MPGEHVERDILTGVEVGEEERVDEGGLAEPGLADDHQGELEPFLDRLPVHLQEIGKVENERTAFHKGKAVSAIKCHRWS